MSSTLDTSETPSAASSSSSNLFTSNPLNCSNNFANDLNRQSTESSSSAKQTSDSIRTDSINATTKDFDAASQTKQDSSNKQSDANENSSKKDDSMFECNICLDTAKEAVVSMCGHLFCWPCLHQWLETRPTRQLCPVCKAAISKEKVIPLYGRGSTKEEDPR